jgi:hypothetical protein
MPDRGEWSDTHQPLDRQTAGDCGPATTEDRHPAAGIIPIADQMRRGYAS